MELQNTIPSTYPERKSPPTTNEALKIALKGLNPKSAEYCWTESGFKKGVKYKSEYYLFYHSDKVNKNNNANPLWIKIREGCELPPNDKKFGTPVLIAKLSVVKEAVYHNGMFKRSHTDTTPIDADHWMPMIKKPNRSNTKKTI